MISDLQKKNRDLESAIEDLREDLEAEKESRSKAERARRELSNEFETLKTECVEAADKSAVSMEIQKKKDEELNRLKVILTMNTNFFIIEIFNTIWF